MAQLTDIPIPLTDPIIVVRKLNLKPGQKDPNEGMVNPVWIPYFNSLGQNFIGVPKQTNTPVSLSGQTGSVTLTPFPMSSTAPGLYRLTFYAQITQAAPVSSSLIVTFSWTNLGASLSTSSAAITGNTTATVSSGTQTVNVDQGSPISYSTTYASVGGPPNMSYALYIVVEAL